MYRIGFITTTSERLDKYFPTEAEPDLVSGEPLFTPDDLIAVECLRNKFNMRVEPVIWGTDVNKLTDFDILVVRSPWDYMDSEVTRQEFISWIDSISSANLRLYNSPRFIKWMIDKHYLNDFDQCGISIVPTEFKQPGEDIDLMEIFNRKGPFIIKPSISAAGFGLRFIHNLDEARANQYMISLESQYTSFMIQDFIEEVKTSGEWSLIYFGEQYSHSVLKKTGSDSILVQAEHGGSLHFIDLDKDIIEFGNRVVRTVPQAFKTGTGHNYTDDALYLRIDILESSSGYLLSECEGAEPELFFRARPGSELLFCQQLTQRLQ